MYMISDIYNTSVFLTTSCGIIGYEGCYYAYHKNYPKFIRNVVNKVKNMNIIYVKMFQLISSSLDLIDKSIQIELIKFTDNVDYSCQDINYPLINNLKNEGVIFEHDSPINAGTIALVYKATYNGRDVAIKIKRNNIHRIIEDGMYNILWLVYILSYIPIVANLNIYKVFLCNKDGLLKQLSFEDEVTNMQKIKANNILNKQVIIPVSYNIPNIDHTNCIIMEYINGIKVQDVEEHDKSKYYTIFMKFCIKCLIFDGFSHGDLHSGNVLFLKDTMDGEDVLKLGILDFGIVNENTIDERDSFHEYFDGLLRKDPDKLTHISISKLTEPIDVYHRLDEHDKQTIYDKMYNINKPMCQDNQFISHNEIIEINKILRSYNLNISKTFMKLQVALWLIQSIGLELMNGDKSKVFVNMMDILDKMFTPFNFDD